ncbi:MAG: PD-(D/E)XK nuclease family protein [Verrucomicrobiales bacterium]
MTSATTQPADDAQAPALRALPNPGGRPPGEPEDGVLRYVSASRLKCWQSCRRQFYYRYVERIETPTAPALFVGQAVHEILRLLNWKRWKDEPCGADSLREKLDRYWEREAPAARVAWKDSGDEEKCRGQAWNLIEAYLGQNPVDPAEKPQGVEVKVECDLGSGIPPLVGIIDLVRGDGTVVDYKTAARTPDPRMAAQQHATQLGCYALLYRAATERTEQGFQLIHLIKTKQPRITVHAFGPMTPAQEAHLFFLIDDYLDGIAAERWIPSPGQHCSWCDHADRCRAQSGIG